VTILVFADTRFPIERANGVQTMATCHALATRGHLVRLVVRPDQTVPARDPFAFYDLPPAPHLRVEPIVAPHETRARRARFLLTALRLATSSECDVVYTRDLGLAALLVRVPTARRPCLVYESHGVSLTVSEEMPRLLGKPELAPSRRKLERLNRREQRVWRRANAYVTITQALAGELAQRYGPRRNVFIVPDGATAPVAQERDLARSSQAAPVAGYAGHLYPWKGVDVFVRALAIASEVHGLIVGGHPGEPDRARVDRQIADLGLADRITITGLVPPSDVRRHLAPATMLVLPNTPSAMSERYTSPLKLFEYLSMGRPIVASDLASIREILTDARTAILVPPGDPVALAAAMRRLAADPVLSAALGAAAGNLAPTYTWERRADRLAAAFSAARAR
jgi:glycosyltransferase involved in cell wall biosynthesis